MILKYNNFLTYNIYGSQKRLQKISSKDFFEKNFFNSIFHIRILIQNSVF